MQIIILLLIVSAHILLLSKLIFFPYPELFIYPYLTKIGLVPYKQIFDQHFPGLMFFPVNLATLGIDTPDEMRLLQYLLVVISQTLIFLVSKKLLKDKNWIFLPNLLYFLWQPYFEGYVLWIDSFTTPILLAAYYFYLNFQQTRQKKELFYLGFTLGIATLFKQVTIPLILIFVFYTWFRYKKLVFIKYYLLGLFIPAFYLLYFAFQNGIWDDILYWTYTFNLTIFADMGRKYIVQTELVKIFPMFVFPLLWLGYLLVNMRQKFLESKFGALTIFFFGCLSFAYARFDFVHLQPALTFSVLSVAILLKEVHSRWKKITLIVFVLISITIVLKDYVKLYGNEVIFYGNFERQIASEVLKYAKSGDKIFAFATLPHIYQLTDTIPSGNIFVFQFPWFMKKAEDRVLAALESDPPKVIIRDKSATVEDINLTKYMAKISKYVDKYYHSEKSVENIEIMIPN